MQMLMFLIPISLALGGLGLAAFFWALRSEQFDDPQGDGARILTDDWDSRPKP
ncbi:cytochrome C oxidase subunit II [Actibacterium mucosum KCTC 23349]|uniref:Cytochrome C oxidase subunit II n=1 Tax=Actibacterium mucosum KCTC 23349 TaxID=1454373 RepID=A0A037ZH71_9RHOB|nr:cbb3-type cytochrome oxidase assembly protein CcoS [Actibacterium mucosum]KAJ54877.1 cytochrome C oxidase subunit II [Actibacterium mucosum KCTC 23349]